MNKYIKGLDGLRGIAIILVMLFHFRLYDFGQIGISVGWVGVQLFFVLSGFLITRILLADREHSLSAYLKKFYWRRSLRIFPLYYAYLLVLTLAFVFVGFPPELSEKAPWLYTYMYNYTRLSPEWTHSVFFTHLWSLSVEEQFYLIWPLFIFFVRGRSLKVALLMIIVLAPAFRGILAAYLQHQTSLDPRAIGEAVYWFTLSHFDAFATGGAVAVFRLNERIKRPGAICGIMLVIALSVGLINLLILPHTIPLDLSSLGYPIASLEYGQHVWSYSLLNGFFAFLILWVSVTPLKAFRISSLVAIGKVSYGMYVFHWAILGAFNQLVGTRLSNSLLSFVVYFGCVYVFSWLSYHFFERYFLKLKDQPSFVRTTGG
jgi:peptidoglycan/LPS O-acetylase OafA/YrhL